MNADDRPRIKIGHVVHRMGIGGMERVVATLVEGVDKKEFTSSVYALAGGGDLMRELEEKGYGTRILAKGPGFDPFLPLRLARLFRQDGIDIVHCHNFGAFAYGALGARMARVRGVVYTAHGPVFPSRGRQAFFQRLPLADRVVTVSEYLRRGAVEEGGLDPSKVVTIRNGVDYGKYAKGDTSKAGERRREIGAGDSEAVIGVVARLSPEKDHATLLKAFASVCAGRSGVRLVVVGDGELMPQLKEMCRALRIEECTVFLGERTDVADLLGALDVFVLSSKDEGLGITLLEAMAAGVPVVATSVGGVPEIVEHGVTGIMVPSGDDAVLADAIAWVLGHRETAAEMALRAGDRVAERFTIDRMIESYESLYRKKQSNE
jgi:sugar transferase (PEP-CTERM/EpsH1 system associated)